MAIIVATTGWPLNVAKPTKVTNGQWMMEFTPNFASGSLSGAKRMAQIGTGTGTPALGWFCLYAFLGTTYICFRWDTGSGNGLAIACTWSSGTAMKAYLDTTGTGRMQLFGATTGNSSASPINGTKAFGAGNMYIGSDSSGGTPWTGTLSDIYDFDHTVAAARPGLGAAVVGSVTPPPNPGGVGRELVVDLSANQPQSTMSTPAAMLNWNWQFSFTPSAASSAGVVGGQVLLESNTFASGLGTIYLFDSSGVHLAVYLSGPSGSGTIVQVDQVITYSAGQTIGVAFDNVAGTMTISGATTGNGIVALGATGFQWPSAATLYIGQDSLSGDHFAGSLSNIVKLDRALEAGLTGSAAGALTDTAAVAAARPGLTGSVAAAQAFTSTAAGAEVGLTAAMSGAVVPAVAFTVAGAEAGLTGAATGATVNPVTGTVAGAEAGLTGSVAGAETYAAAMAGSEAGLTGSAAIAQTLAATVDAARPGLDALSSGGQTIAGAVATSEPGLVGFVPSNNDVNGTVAAARLGLDAAVAGTIGNAYQFAVAGVEAGLTGAAAATQTIAGTVAGAEAGLTGSLSGSLSHIGTIAADRPGLTGAAVAAQTLAATVAGAEAGLDAAVNALRYSVTVAGAEAGLTGSAAAIVAVPLTGVIAAVRPGLTALTSDYAAPSDSAWSGAFTGHGTTYPAVPADVTGDPSGGLFVSPTVALSVALSGVGPAGGAFSSGSSQARAVPGASTSYTGPASGGFADMQFADPVPGAPTALVGTVAASPAGLVAVLSALRFNGTVAAARLGLTAVVDGLRISGTIAGAEAGLVGATGELPDPGAGFSYLVNSAGAYLVDVNGSLLYGKT